MTEVFAFTCSDECEVNVAIMKLAQRDVTCAAQRGPDGFPDLQTKLIFPLATW